MKTARASQENRFRTRGAVRAAAFAAAIVCAAAVVFGLAGNSGLAGLPLAAGSAAAQAAAPPPAPRTAPAPTGSAAGAATDREKQEGFSERVVVREIEVVVELPASLHESRRKSLLPQEFQVLEDGTFRQVVKAGPVGSGDAAPWHVVLYFDRVLASPATIFFTANSLAQQAQRLSALGNVDLVIADPEPRLLVAGSREPKLLEQALIDVAAQAEKQRDADSHGNASGTAGAKPQAPQGQPAAGQAAARPGQGAAAGAAGGAGPDAATVRRQEDRLVCLLAGFPGGGPRALVLVADGFDTSASGDKANTATAAVAGEPARTLAAYGWVTIAAPMRKQDLGTEHREVTDVERIRQQNSGREAPGSTLPPENLPQVAPNTSLNYDGVLNVFVRPTSESLNAMAGATSGAVVGFPNQLEAALTSLSKRWHLFYLAPDPEDGRTRPVEVRLPPSTSALRSPVWRRSSTTEEVAAARAREVLAGAADHGTLPVSATAPRQDPRSLRLRVSPYSPADAFPAGPFRVTLVYVGAAGADAAPTVHHQLLNRADLGEKGWDETVPLAPPPGTRRLAVEVEDLNHQLWGAATIDLAPGT